MVSEKEVHITSAEVMAGVFLSYTHSSKAQPLELRYDPAVPLLVYLQKTEKL